MTTPENDSGLRGSSSFQSFVSFAALFTSTGTLLCCALPAALAAIAGGSAVIALLGSVPWLIPLSRHKDWIFLAAGLMLLINGLVMFRGLPMFRPIGDNACAVDGGRGCAVAGRFTKIMFWGAVVIFAIGGFFAYLIVPILRLVD